VTSAGGARWVTEARKARQANRPIEALIHYRRAIHSASESVQAHLELGELLLELGRQDEARKAWQAALVLRPDHVPSMLALAGLARQTGAFGEATAGYDRVLHAVPRHPEAALGLALSRVGAGDESGYAEFETLLNGGATEQFWNELAKAAATSVPSQARTSLLLKIASSTSRSEPHLLLACAAEELAAAGAKEAARELLARVEARASEIEDPETLRRFGLAAARVGIVAPWAERYASRCAALFSLGPLPGWPRRTRGDALRVAYLVAPEMRLSIGGTAVDLKTYVHAVVASHAPERIVPTLWILGAATPSAVQDWLPQDVVAVALDAAPADAAIVRSLAEADSDALIDLVGLNAATGPLLAQRLARTTWTYRELVGANAAPLITHTLPSLSGAGADALAQHRAALENAMADACHAAPWFADAGARTALELNGAWRAAVEAHQRGDPETALAGYREILIEQPGYAPAHYLLGRLLREAGQPKDAARSLEAAIDAAPAYLEARIALSDLLRENQRPARAVAVCEEGLRHAPDEPLLWRALGLARLQQRDSKAARRAFGNALALAPAHAMTHYNQGVALQMLGCGALALRAYQRALALDPELTDAEFNVGIIFREQHRLERAIEAFERVLARNPTHVPAHKALADTLLDQRQIARWLEAFDRFEAACPDALPLLVVALQACQYRADFARLDRYLDRLRRDEFKTGSETELADCLEELLFLLLYFDFEPDSQLGLYKTYDAVARRVYGAPLALPEARKPGRIRVGYLSGDLRNHVMGKMMWSALQRHDRSRFELFFYALSDESDEWTERYRGLAHRFEVVAGLSEHEAAARIAADELDLLVDLATHTRGSRPGILALKPARVQVTHVASAGPVGLSTIDFKLTDDYADLPEMGAFQLEAFLPMAGCVYPYRRMPPAMDHPFSRDRLDIAADAVVIGAFVNPLKLSRRCLALWRDVLDRIPGAVLAISPMSVERREVYGRLLAASGIAESRVRVLPQGRDEAENQARYSLVDFVLDPMPYGGANGTLEALDMGVPVVTLVGRRHGERSTMSILTNLGVTQTIAASGSEYVEIAVRLARDAGFRSEVKAAIAAGLARSPLVDMDAHTRHLEQAYARALEQRYPQALGVATEN